MKSDTLVAEVPPPQSEVNETEDRANRRRKISDRLAYLATLEDGWFEGRGVSLDKAGLRWLDCQIDNHFVSTDLPMPFLFPTVPGGVMMEWSLERFECAIEIDLKARTGPWLDVNLETDEGIDEEILDLDSSDGWQWLIDRLRRFVGES